jgi:hypothetical protein
MLTSSNFEINAAFDAATIARIQALENSDMRFNSHVMSAIQQSLPELQEASVSWMFGHFKNPSGELESTWEQEMLSWNEGALINSSPYAQRRHFGFSGHTDALGRTYLNDPGIFWASNAIDMATPFIEQIFQAEMEVAANGA